MDSLFVNNEKDNILFEDVFETHGDLKYRILIDELFEHLNSNTINFE